jgi:hypothetical protein
MTINRREALIVRRLVLANQFKSIRSVFEHPLVKKWVKTWNAKDQLEIKVGLDILDKLPEKEKAIETRKMMNMLKKKVK